MPYFSSFNYVLYPNPQDANNFLILKNITSRVVRKLSLVDDTSLFYEYTILEGEKPEDVSYKLYGTVEYYWTFFIINKVFDVYYDFPMSSAELDAYIVDKYGSSAAAMEEQNYFIRLDPTIVNSNALADPTTDRIQNMISVPYNFQVRGIQYNFTTYPQYQNGVLMKTQIDSYSLEVEKNEVKRNILVLNSQYITTFVNEFNKLISQ